ncbi:MAG: WD40 repeat domain-containing protein [Planctomycetaceae bacterium]
MSRLNTLLAVTLITNGLVGCGKPESSTAVPAQSPSVVTEAHDLSTSDDDDATDPMTLTTTPGGGPLNGSVSREEFNEAMDTIFTLMNKDRSEHYVEYAADRPVSTGPAEFSDANWIAAEVQRVGVDAVLSRREEVGETPSGKMLYQSLLLAADVLRYRPHEAWSQLRLHCSGVGESEIKTMFGSGSQTQVFEPIFVTVPQAGGPVVARHHHLASGQNVEVRRLMVLPDNKHALTMVDSSVHIWELSTGKTVNSITLEELYYASDVAMSPNGQQLAFACSKGIVKVMGIDGSVPVTTIETGEESGSFDTIAISGNGRVAVGKGDYLAVWDIASNSLVSKMDLGEGGPIFSCTFTPDNKRLIAGTFHEFSGWDVDTAKLHRRYYVGHVQWVGLSHDGTKVLGYGSGLPLTPFDLETGDAGAALVKIGYGDDAAIRTVPGTDVVVACIEDQPTVMYDIITGDKVGEMSVLDGCKLFAMTDDGRYLLRYTTPKVAAQSKVIDVIDRTMESMTSPSEMPREVATLQLLESGTYSFARGKARGKDSVVEIRDARTGKLVSPTSQPEERFWQADALAVTEDSAFLSTQEGLKRIDLVDGVNVSTIDAPPAAIAALAVLDDTTAISHSHETTTLRIWNPSTGQVRYSIDCGEFSSVEFTLSRLSRRVLARFYGDAPKAVVIDLESGEKLIEKQIDPDQSRRGNAKCFGMSPDGKRLLISATTKKEIDCYDIDAKTVLYQFHDFGPTEAVSFSSNGKLAYLIPGIDFWKENMPVAIRWDMNSGDYSKQTMIGGPSADFVAATSSEDYVILGYRTGDLIVAEFKTGKPIATLRTGIPISHMTYRLGTLALSGGKVGETILVNVHLPSQ